MPYYEKRVSIRCPQRDAYEFAKRMEDFPRYMEAVRKVEIAERGDDWTVTKWEAVAMGFPFKWQERDEFDDANLRIRYHVVKGDLKTFEGEWTFTEAPGGETVVALDVSAELGVPLFAPMINPLLGKILQLNVDSMLDGLKKELETGRR
ncbi:MAG TPA: SRPBCC family protein [Limnochordia bacterium]|nr:SRPBCC family protein [Limnochordia bacterium]